MSHKLFNSRQDLKYAGKTESVPLTLRIDTSIEVVYYRHGGILPYVLRELLSAA
jgi:aconitate hydratase